MSRRVDPNGSTILITGAARGIGAGAARELARRGANVALVGLEPEQLERTAAECGPNAAWFEADVTDTDALDRAVAGTLERFGKLDCVVANAGVAPVGSVRLIDPAAFERTIEINLLGVWRTVRATLPAIVESQGHVLAIASIAAILPSPGLAAYCASKAGTEAFARSLRSEVRRHGVTVGIGYFSWIDTDLVRGADAHPVGGRMRAKLSGPMGKTYPLSATSEAIARGIERRSRRVVVPSWVPALLLGRGLFEVFGPVFDWQAGRIAAQGEDLMAAEIERRGAASATAPVGAGGEAAMAARERSGVA
jgi:NAD(P)-dependent dehydrogenase (short-subunit alcohol dehydrogenase family)